ncbi:Aste57867_14061 [Aphanomyces stellatus]|uniref:Aste57867_14061 protein n=1 Tax=Aphanomyces stellatus TaxID=120398 RepID=A0A485L0M4_9STRA|nr:hypothetical protein As57867_014010 [Aphanomyces stellatus]VFT90889.1 Aste57867_14061 [Aphanomyces stellatus]
MVARTRRELALLRNLHRRKARLDPLYADDLFTIKPPTSRLLARIQPDVPSPADSDPYITAYISRVKATTLVDTGASNSFISASPWHKLGCPSLSNPKSGFLAADMSQIEHPDSDWCIIHYIYSD